MISNESVLFLFGFCISIILFLYLCNFMCFELRGRSFDAMCFGWFRALFVFVVAVCEAHSIGVEWLRNFA